MFSDPIRLPPSKSAAPVFALPGAADFYFFSICSNSSQRNSIFILYNKGAVREEQKNILPRCHAGNENRAFPAETGRRGPFKKHCPPRMRGNSQCGGQTTNHLLTTANVWEFSYDRQRRFLLLSTALAVFVWFPPPSQRQGIIRSARSAQIYLIWVERRQGASFSPSDTRPEPGSGLFLRQKP